MRQEPTIITGPRSPENRTPHHETVPNAFVGRTEGIKEGKRVFQAVAGKYRIQVTAPQSLKFADGRIVEGGKPIVIQFENYEKVLDIQKDAELINAIESHPQYGSDFWDFAGILEKGRQNQIDAAVRLLQDPVAKEAIVLALAMSGDSEFDLPEAPGAKKIAPTAEAE